MWLTIQEEVTSSSMEKQTVDRCLACEGGILKTTRACWIWNDYSQGSFSIDDGNGSETVSFKMNSH